MDIAVVVAVDHQVDGLGAWMKIQCDFVSGAAQFRREVDKIALAIDDARTALQRSALGPEVDQQKSNPVMSAGIAFISTGWNEAFW